MQSPSDDAELRQRRSAAPVETDESLYPDVGQDSDDQSSVAVAAAKEPQVPGLESLSPRWRNWFIRFVLTLVMIGGFSFIVYVGPLAITLLVLAIQMKCYSEIINIGYVVYKSHDLPWFRTLSWYFLICSNYFFYGESLIHYFGVLLMRTEFLQPFVTYHRFISFSIYVAGFVVFVLNLVKRQYLKQFLLFGWTHVALVVLIGQSHFFIHNMFEGLVWFLVPVSMVICNDIMAYVFGFFFGRTPLIKLSPKKTWEGFIGGAFSTVVIGLIISYTLIQFDYFVCPIQYNEELGALSMDCERHYVFRLNEYTLPGFAQKLLMLVGCNCKTVTTYPFMLHTFNLAVICSVIGPFGGFFASGFKRAFKIKDFGDTIPGHGGFLDRFDCQILMATFVNVYYSSFIRTASPQRLFQQIMTMKQEEQLELFFKLKTWLNAKKLL